MPLVFYQVLHVISLLALSAFAYGIICSDHNKTLKKLYGLASFFVLLGGFGLIARLGYNFKDNPWLTVKLIVWFALSFVLFCIAIFFVSVLFVIHFYWHFPFFTIIDNLSTGSKKNIPKKAHFLKADISDTKKIQKIFFVCFWYRFSNRKLFKAPRHIFCRKIWC